MKILVMGPSGAGKTYLTKELSRFGVNAVDSDDLLGLYAWYDCKKEKVPFPEDFSQDFLDNHQFLWDRFFLENFLKHNQNVYLFGMAGNVFEMLDLFEKVYFLKVPEDVIIKRLDHKSRENPMGKIEHQKRAVLEWSREIEEKADKLKVQKIDGTLTSIEIFQIIKAK